MFISFLYMFRTTMCPSSGEITVSMRHLVFVTLCGRLSGMQGKQGVHTRQSSTQNDKNQVSHRYSYFSWWWAHSRPKHVEKRNKHTKKSCAPSWLYLQDYARMHGQENIKYRVRINYRRILQNHIFTNTEQKYMKLLPFERGMIAV